MSSLSPLPLLPTAPTVDPAGEKRVTFQDLSWLAYQQLLQTLPPTPDA